MPALLLLGWDFTNEQAVKVAVDENGILQMSTTVGNLNDIGDVSVASPTGLYIFYYNGVTSQWECQAISGWKLDDLGAPDDNTDLDASTSKHGLMSKNDKTKLDGVAAGADVTGDNAPQAHKATHQNGGADEIDVSGLSGELADAQTPKEHDLGGSEHGQDTLANLNSKISDATLDDSSSARTPSAHASSHQNGGADEVASATPAANTIPKTGATDKLDTWITDASDTAKGKVELATAAETSAGSDATRGVTPDGLAGSNFGKRTIEIAVSDPNGDAITTGDLKAYIRIPAEYNGMNLVTVAAHVTTASSSGAITVQIRNVTDTQDMLSTEITIDESETDTDTAETAAVIDTDHDDVATSDIIAVDIDGAGTGAKGLLVALTFQLP